MTARLVLVRHGQTEWSRDGRHTSTTDLPLTEEGREQARGLVESLAGFAFDAVVSSPRRRARETARLAGFSDPRIDDDLVEWDYGDLEGLTTPQIRETQPGWSVWTHPSPGGETSEQIAARLDRFIAGVRRGGGTTLAVGHGHALRALAARWIGQPVALGQFLVLDTGTWSLLGDDRGTPALLRWNAPPLAS